MTQRYATECRNAITRRPCRPEILVGRWTAEMHAKANNLTTVECRITIPVQTPKKLGQGYRLMKTIAAPISLERSTPARPAMPAWNYVALAAAVAVGILLGA